MAEISTYHLGANPALYEPARTNCFQFQISPELDTLLTAGVDVIQDDDYLHHVQEIIRLSVIECDVPHFSIDPIEVKRGNSKVLFAGQPSFKSGSLKLNDFVGARTKDALMAWQALAYDVIEDVVNLAANYKFDCTLIEYNPDMSKVLRKWTLVGCWISELSEGSFNVENNEKRDITATIQYDRAIPQVDKTSFADIKFVSEKADK